MMYQEDETKIPHIVAGGLFINGNTINTIYLDQKNKRINITTNNMRVEQYISSSNAKGLYDKIIDTIREGKLSLIEIPMLPGEDEDGQAETV